MNLNSSSEIKMQPVDFAQPVKPATAAPGSAPPAEETVKTKTEIPREEAVEEQSPEEIHETVENLNEYMDDLQTNLGFKVDDTSEDVVIMVTDRKTDEVLKQIPSKELLKLRDSMAEMTGILFSDQA